MLTMCFTVHIIFIHFDKHSPDQGCDTCLAPEGFKRSISGPRPKKVVHHLSKDTTAFWKTWESKFKSKRKTSVAVDGFTEPHKIANAFATNFKNACSPNNETRNHDLKNKFLARFSQYHPAC